MSCNRYISRFHRPLSLNISLYPCLFFRRQTRSSASVWGFQHWESRASITVSRSKVRKRKEGGISSFSMGQRQSDRQTEERKKASREGRTQTHTPGRPNRRHLLFQTFIPKLGSKRDPFDPERGVYHSIRWGERKEKKENLEIP